MMKQVDLGLPRSDYAAIGDKRCSDELGEKPESGRKRAKFRDLHSVLSSEEISANNRGTGDKFQLGGEISRLTNAPAPLGLDTSRTGSNERDGPITKPLDLNSDVSSAVPNDSFCSSKNGTHMKSRTEASECGSTTGPAEERDSFRVWKEMKENGFLSSSSHGGISVQSSLISSIHGGIPMPKQRGRKSKADVLKKKMELAKKEQVDRFTKIAAPSGLLNGLNPGIINHVRNKRQVHSIIEALVRSEKNDHGGETKHQITETKQLGNNPSGLGNHQISCSEKSGVSAMVSGSKQLGAGSHKLSTVDCTSGQNLVSHSNDSESLALKLSSTKEDSNAFSDEKSADDCSISCLSVRAASVASQWLELLHQDIKGRLSALGRSRKRVRAVITTELPFLISKEFTSNRENRENDPTSLKSLCDEQADDMISAMHQTKWSTLFDQMDKALSEEEKHLESCLEKVKEMQVHSDQGVQSIQWNSIFGFLQQGTSESRTRIGRAESTERGLAVRAAAASIYSTCSFLMSKENVSCF